MKKRWICIILVLCVALSMGGCGVKTAGKQLTMSQKLDDFNYMYRILQQNYPYFNVEKRQQHFDWLSHKNSFEQDIRGTKTDADFFETLKIIMSMLQNGHAHMLDDDEYTYDRSLYTSIPQGTAAWQKVLHAPTAVKRYAAQKKGQQPSASSGAASYAMPNNIETAALGGNVAYLAIRSLNLYNIDGDMKTIVPFLQKNKGCRALIIDIRGNGGGDSQYWSDHLVPMLLQKPLSYTTYDAYRGGAFSEQFLKSKFGFGYEHLQPVSSLDDLPNLPPELKTDFRYVLREQDTITPENPVGFAGKIDLLIDHNVFSSSEMFAVFCKSTGFATLVGERTGGDGIGYDPALCVLPNSGYIFSFPQMMGLTADGTCNFEKGTAPDIAADAGRNADFNQDQAVQAAIRNCR